MEDSHIYINMCVHCYRYHTHIGTTQTAHTKHTQPSYIDNISL